MVSLEVVILSLAVIMILICFRVRFFLSTGEERVMLFSLFFRFSSGGTGSGFVFLLLPLAGFFLGSHGAQLEGVDAVLLGHLIAEKGVDHAVTGRLHLGVEGVGGDDHAKVCLAGGSVIHGLVVGVKMRVIVDLESLGVEGRGDLGSNKILNGSVGVTHG